MRAIARATWALTVLALTAAAPASAQTDIHGFGGWGYGRTDGNYYLLGSDDGDWHHHSFALNVATNPVERLRITAQMEWLGAHETDEVRLGYAFAEWRFSDAARFLGGKVKHPFGIYSEIREVGILRPFFSLPAAAHGPVGVSAESLLGLSFRGRRSAGDWEIAYDLYGGEIELLDSHPWHDLGEVHEEGQEENHADDSHAEGTTEHVRDVIGGRLVVSTPADGLSFGVSAFAGAPEESHVESDDEASSEPPSWGDHSSLGAHAEYLGDKWLFRGEYVLHSHEGSADSDGAYAEVAYKLTEHWQAAARYDWANAEIRTVEVAAEVAAYAPSLTEHRDIAVGLNYWFADGFVVKAAYHIVEGNRFALPPTDLAETVESGLLTTDTGLFELGVHFGW